MKKYFLTICFFIIFTFQIQLGFAVNIGEKAPDLEIINISDNIKYRLSDFRDKVLFVNFWATWCESCRQETPTIQSLHNHFMDDKRFQIITVLYRDNYHMALEYMKENSYDFPLFLDSNEKSAFLFGVTGIPESYVIDKKGVIRIKRIGAEDWGSQEVISQISRLIDEATDIIMAPSLQESRRGISDQEALGACGTVCGSFMFTIIAVLVLHIALLVWVAKDAKNRGMGSSVGWIFLVLFTGVIGLIIYLFSRPKGELVICDVCKNKKFKVARVCPHCGNPSQPAVMSSRSRVQAKYCVKCGSEVSSDAIFCKECGNRVEQG